MRHRAVPLCLAFPRRRARGRAEMAAMLQLMMPEGAGSPCPEVFTF